MKRKIAVVGDALERGGQILPYSGRSSGFGDARHQVALIGGEAYCEACKSIGVIAKAGGPRRIRFMGETALDKDIVLCKCATPPIIMAQLAGNAWGDDMVESMGVVASPAASSAQQDASTDALSYMNGAFDEQLRLLSPQGIPLANMAYRMLLRDESVHFGVTDAEGRTRRIPHSSRACLRAAFRMFTWRLTVLPLTCSSRRSRQSCKSRRVKFSK